MKNKKTKILETLEKLANDYRVCPEEITALDYASDCVKRDEWHKYPDEKPDSDSAMLITYVGYMGAHFVDIGWFDKDASWYDEIGCWFTIEEEQRHIDNVIAWKELPKPYREE